jgi:hypothetical protein
MKKVKVKMIALFCVIMMIATIVNAQKAPMRYGKVDAALVAMKVYEPDTTAHAVILGDYGVVEIKYDRFEGFQYTYTRHIRVKIFNRDAFDLADFSLPLAKSGIPEERLMKLQAVVFNMDDGKITKTQFKRKDAFVEEIGTRLKLVKFALPNVREGSVFDVEYAITSPFLFTLPDWYFQSTYPTEFSELRLIIPEYYNYKPLVQGFVKLSLHEESLRTANFVAEWEEQDRSGNVYKYSRKVDFMNQVIRFRINNVPAFTIEPFMNSAINYLTKVEHELVFYKPPFGVGKDYSSSWAKITNMLMESESFGKQFQKSGFLSSEVASIKANYETPIERIIAAHAVVQNTMEWNGFNSLYVKSSLRKAWNDKKGNAADINLMLVLLLKELDIEAHPVILSTRKNGMVNPAQIMISKYNYVIAYAEFEGKTILLDATNKRTPFFLLPERCINGQGRLISETKGKFVKLDAIENNNRHANLDITVNPSGTINVKRVVQSDNYYKLDMLEHLRTFNSEEEYMDKYEADNLGITLNSFTVENKDNWTDPLICTYEFDIKELDEAPKNILYINPFSVERIETNPFRIENRMYPVDFIYPRKRTYSITINIPEGYLVDELPRDSRTNLPNRGGSYSCFYKHIENQVILNVEIDIRKAMYLTDEYHTLKEFYGKIIEEQARQIVLKKA